MTIKQATLKPEKSAMNCKKLAVLWLVFALFPLGCLVSKDKGFIYREYSYKSIKKEYADLVCKLSPLQIRDQQGECALNQPLSLPEAIRIARENNPDTQMAVARIRKAEADLQRSNAAFYPKIGFYTEYLKGDAPSAYLFKKIDQRKLPANTNFNDPGSIENYESGVRLRMNLFNGGRDILNRRMAQTGLSVAQLDRESVENALIASVIGSFYDVLAAEEYIAIAEESVATIREQHRIMQVRFDAGGALKSDILSLKVRLAEAREELSQSRNRKQIALAALANVLGVDPNAGLQVKASQPLSPALPKQYLAGLRQGLDQRPEKQKLEKQTEQARMALDVARAAWLPAVNLHSSYYLDDPDMDYDRDRENWTVAVMCNWDIFTGFARFAGQKQAHAALEEILAADRKTDLAIKLDIKTAYLNWQEAKTRMEVAQSSVAAAEESLSLVKKQYEGGSATITRYLEAELDRNRARMRAATAFYDQQKAVAEIGRAVGYWAKLSG